MRWLLVLLLLLALPASSLETVWGQASSGGANVLTDGDGDGNPDYIFVQGDYNGDGSVTNADIQDAILALTDTDSERTVRVSAGVYDGSGVSNGTLALISIPANTALICDPGAVIKGPDVADPDFPGGANGKTVSTRIITNSAVVDPSDLTQLGDDADDPGIVISGCELYYDLPASYDSTGWTWNEDHFGIYLERATRAIITNNRVSKTTHTCIYLRSLVDAFVNENYLGDGCGNANDANGSGSNQQGIYLYAAEGVDTERVIVANNTCIEAGNDCFHTRAQFTCTGTDDGDEDGDLCRLDNATTGGATNCTTTNGTCSEAYIKNVIFEGNIASGHVNSGMRLGSARHSIMTGNVVNGGTYGIELAGISDGEGLCDTANDVSDDANCWNSIIGNQISQTTNNGIIIQGGNQDTTIKGNSLTDIQATCTRFFPPFDRMTYEENTHNGCNIDGGASQNFVVVNISSAAATAETSTIGDLTVKNNTATKIGVDGSDRDRGALMEVDYLIGELRVIGNSIAQTTAAAFAQICLRLDTVPTALYVNDLFCGDNDEQVPESDAVSDALIRGSVIVQEADPTAIFTSDTCGETGAIWRDSTAATGASYECRNGVWVAM